MSNNHFSLQKLIVEQCWWEAWVVVAAAGGNVVGDGCGARIVEGAAPVGQVVTNNIPVEQVDGKAAVDDALMFVSENVVVS